MEKETLLKWLKWILILSIAHLTFIYAVPNSSAYVWRQWVLYAISAAKLYCFFHLMHCNKNYSRAVIFMIIELVLQVINHLLNTVFLQDLIKLFPGQEPLEAISVITTPISVLMTVSSFIAYILELWAHSDLVAPFDASLAKKWKNLFLWNLGAGLIVSTLSAILVTLQQTAVLDMTVYKTIYPMVNLPTIAIQVLYMLYLWRTMQKINTKEEMSDGN